MKNRIKFFGIIMVLAVVAILSVNTLYVAAAMKSAPDVPAGKIIMETAKKALRCPATWSFIFIVFDVLSGILKAVITGTWDSSKMREGGGHKLVLLLILLLGGLCDVAQMMIDLGFQLPILFSVSVYIIFTELGSCMENLDEAYPGAIPKELRSAIANARKAKDILFEGDDK